MKSIYSIVAVILGLLFAWGLYYQRQYEGLEYLFEVAKDLDKKELFTQEYKTKAIASWTILDDKVEWGQVEDEYFLEALALVLNEFSSQNSEQLRKNDTLYYDMMINLRDPIVLRFELVPSPLGVQINDIENIEKLFAYVVACKLAAKLEEDC